MIHFRGALLSGVLAGLLAACNHVSHVPPTTVAPVAADAPVARVFLIGDAGAPRIDEPVLRALGTEIAEAPEQSIVVFLGDNIYPSGLPSQGAPDRAESERRLEAQVLAVVEAGGRAIFVPGNHDWEGGGADGWNRIRMQGDFIDERGRGRAALLPRGGCPGPVVEDVGDALRLVMIDTQWWLHGHDKPAGAADGCAVATPAEMTQRLRAVLRAAGDRATVVTAHHPIATGSVHGGHFSFLDHLFPLRAVNDDLWIPFPVIGSIYPFARQSGISSQDLSSGAYGGLVDSLRAAFQANPPLVYAAGHDHNLQVFDGEVEHVSVVSGSGYWDHGSQVHWIEGMRYGSSEAGYVVLDVLPDRRVRLGVREVDGAGVVTEPFSMWIR
jgi:hypothetical protein